jgi:hypothetical protein
MKECRFKKNGCCTDPWKPGQVGCQVTSPDHCSTWQEQLEPKTDKGNGKGMDRKLLDGHKYRRKKGR